MNNNVKIWDYKVEEIIKGYRENPNEYFCTRCGTVYQKGRIYPVDEALYDAMGAIKEHIHKEHGWPVDYLLTLKGNLTGLSEMQQKLLKLMSEGKNDKEIAAALGIAASTVRNHRFKLREKEKQAVLFLAMMQSLAEKTSRGIGMSDKGAIEGLHTFAAMIDERYSITEPDSVKVRKSYMDENGAIKQFPAKEKNKIILLREVMNNFKKDRDYTEKQVNMILKRIYEKDYVYLRRALIEYGFMERPADCSVYRVRE